VAKFYNENSGLKIDYALWKKSLWNSDSIRSFEKTPEQYQLQFSAMYLAKAAANSAVVIVSFLILR
jgi:hypothetical protein